VSEKYYILTIDGGGFRGAYAAHILKRMEAAWGVDWLKQFNMFAGTSTGAIIATGLATGLTAKKLFELYSEQGARIFEKRWYAKLDPFGFTSIFASRYKSAALRDILLKTFGNKKLGDIATPLMLPAIDIGGGQVHLFRSSYDKEFVRDPQVLLADAVLASCSAPTYFDPHVVEPYPLADGGLWANNPALIAVIDAKRRLGIDLADIRVLSIGTGKSRTFYPRVSGPFVDRLWNSWRGWGFATRWGHKQFIDLLLNLQSDTTHNMLRLLFKTNSAEPEQLLRINFESDLPLPMDDPRRLPDWTRHADRDFSHNAARIKAFLQLAGSTIV